MAESGMSVRYGGFWIRLLAGLIDYIIVGTVLALVFGLIIHMFPGSADFLQPPHHLIRNALNVGENNFQRSSDFNAPGFINAIVFLLYYSVLESSKWQASVGMKIFGLKITDQNFQRISFLRAMGREISSHLSAYILFIGYFMIGWTQKKQGLHDMIANTYVIRE